MLRIHLRNYTAAHVFHLLSQVGAVPSHTPSIPHTRVSLPIKVKSPVQVYVAIEPGVFPSSTTLPFSGFSRTGHSITVVKVEGEATAELRLYMFRVVMDRELHFCN